MIQLRPVRCRDWCRFIDLFNDHDIKQELPFLKPLTKIEYFFWFLSIIFNFRPGLIYSRAICDNDKLIGIIFLEQYSQIHMTANISFDLAASYQGRGIAKKTVTLFCNHAFSNLKLNRINAIVRPSNQKSQSLLVKVGFIKEAYLKQYVHFKGDLIDVFLYRLCRDER